MHFRRTDPIELPTPHVLAARERERLALALGDAATGLGPALDAVARLARDTTGGRQAFVNLVTAERMLHRGRAVPGGADELPASTAPGFCPYAVATARVLAVPDTLADERTRDNPATTAGVRAYLGAPLFVGEHAVGTVCVIDAAPRAWTPAQADAVVELAELAAAQLTSAGVLRAA